MPYCYVIIRKIFDACRKVFDVWQTLFAYHVYRYVSMLVELSSFYDLSFNKIPSWMSCSKKEKKKLKWMKKRKEIQQQHSRSLRNLNTKQRNAVISFSLSFYGWIYFDINFINSIYIFQWWISFCTCMRACVSIFISMSNVHWPLSFNITVCTIWPFFVSIISILHIQFSRLKSPAKQCTACYGNNCQRGCRLEAISYMDV